MGSSVFLDVELEGYATNFILPIDIPDTILEHLKLGDS
jgi:hypothetical protein